MARKKPTSISLTSRASKALESVPNRSKYLSALVEADERAWRIAMGTVRGHGYSLADIRAACELYALFGGPHFGPDAVVAFDILMAAPTHLATLAGSYAAGSGLVAYLAPRGE